MRALYMYAEPLRKELAGQADVVGIFDPNPLRAETVRRMAGLECPVYTDCARLLAEQKPDRAVIATIDREHHTYAVQCMEAGAEAIVEKPLAIGAEQCRAILDAERRTGRRVRVTFNLRFAPYPAAVKKLLREGALGEILSIDLEWMLDTSHGADYFRRWHRRKENSGGLLVHKASHHFDLINWWLEQTPVSVAAHGALRFYGPTRAERGERCLTCRFRDTCEFRLDLTASPFLSAFYRDCEAADGYYRDRCVFADEIDIEDTMSATVRYDGGALLSYALNAHTPYEGYRAAFNGRLGRMEIAEFHSGPRVQEPTYSIVLFDRQGRRTEQLVPKAEGGHGGGDERLRRMLFVGDLEDPLGQQADAQAGARACLIGIAANRSIATGQTVRIRDLLPLD